MKLVINDVIKQFGKKRALNGFSAVLENGVYGLLGPNGSGKTTLINIVVGLLQPDYGSVKLNDIETKKLGKRYLEKIGYLPQNPQFYKGFKAREFLLYMCSIKGMAKLESETRTEQLLANVNLLDESNKKISSFSGGMKQRLGIAQALLNDPDIIILDEPTAGLDPKERIRFRNIVSKLASNKIILLATHIVSDIEYIAKEVILIKDGSMIKQDKPSNLLNYIGDKVWSIQADETEIANIIDKYNISSAVFNNGMYVLRVVNDMKPAEEAIKATPKLEDVYIYYFREMQADENCKV